jgi:hypothetical protein
MVGVTLIINVKDIYGLLERKINIALLRFIMSNTLII